MEVVEKISHLILSTVKDLAASITMSTWEVLV